MQPAPSEAFQNATSVDQIPNTSSSYHHGLPNPTDWASAGLRIGAVAREPSPPADQADAASIASSDTRQGRCRDTGRMSSSPTSSYEGSAGSRIEEYERAFPSTSKNHTALAFRVVSAGNKNSHAVVIDQFPNEVLTHILSHLTPEALSAMSLVSKRFHKLVTTPHAWRVAFARYFPGSDAADAVVGSATTFPSTQELHSERRAFSRLSALASWRSEYILRTRMLRSLGRGRPALHAVSRSGSSRHSGTSAAAVMTYGSGLLYPVSHFHATFGVGLNKKQPLFIHGAAEQGIASISDPSAGKIGNWGLGDFEGFKHFADLFAGDSEYGLGSGNVVGMPNVMDISQPYGKLYGEACPGGRLFYTSVTEQRGRFLNITSPANIPSGIPEVTMLGCSVCSVWIAKSEGVPKTTNGLIGLLAGFSNGVLAAYALGVNPVHDRRLEKGELTAKWVLCPGVPIIAIQVDDRFSGRRHGLRRVWAAVLNALGEVFYLTDVPTRPEFKGKLNAADTENLAWQTARSVEWSLIEHTRRTAKPDPFNTALVDGSYTPRSSNHAMGLSQDQIIAETKEIENFLVHKPIHFRSICEGWDMRRKLVVDFGGNDRHGAGESIFVLNCGVEGEPATVRRLSRRKTKTPADFHLETFPKIQPAPNNSSLFGSSAITSHEVSAAASPCSAPRSRTSSHNDGVDSIYKVEWLRSSLGFGDLRNVSITTTTTDDSDYASLATFEDPLLGMSGGSNASSPLASPLGTSNFAGSSSEIPGHRARFLAIGTTSGVVVLWDMRASTSPAVEIVNTVQPTRTIYTKSPQISSLAMTSLYLVHGGNDGLVQAWDPLASTLEPIRTLNSRFSDRARRRIAQAEATPQGVGNNYYAAGAVVLDPDPTVLRGMVSLGTHLRYWSYSSSAADAYKSRKRGQLRRRSERGSNSASNEQRYTHTGRGVLRDYIANEKVELEREKIAKRKENERLSGRFGVGLLGEDISEDEMLRYAMMISEEEDARRKEGERAAAGLPTHGGNLGDERSSDADARRRQQIGDDMEEAIRLSLLDCQPRPQTLSSTPAPGASQVPIRYTKSKNSRHGTPIKSVGVEVGSSKAATTAEEQNELEFALQLSLAEERSRQGDLEVEEEYPALGRMNSSSDGSGGPCAARRGLAKGKRRAA